MDNTFAGTDNNAVPAGNTVDNTCPPE